jgi:hypothetical protein
MKEDEMVGPRGTTGEMVGPRGTTREMVGARGTTGKMVGARGTTGEMTAVCKISFKSPERKTLLGHGYGYEGIAT